MYKARMPEAVNDLKNYTIFCIRRFNRKMRYDFTSNFTRLNFNQHLDFT